MHRQPVRRSPGGVTGGFTSVLGVELSLVANAGLTPAVTYAAGVDNIFG